MDSAKMAEKLWDTANIIAGFAIVQAIATTFSLARLDLKALIRAGGARHAAH